MPRKTIEDMWLNYFMRVIPDKSTPKSLRDQEFAFYAGAASMHALIVNSFTEKGATVVKIHHQIEALKEEMCQFAVEKGRGKL